MMRKSSGRQAGITCRWHRGQCIQNNHLQVYVWNSGEETVSLAMHEVLAICNEVLAVCDQSIEEDLDIQKDMAGKISPMCRQLYALPMGWVGDHTVSSQTKL